VDLLRLGEGDPNLLAEPAVAQAQQRGLQRQVGAPAWRSVQSPEVQHRKLAEQFEDKSAAGQPVLVPGHDAPDQVQFPLILRPQ
jgi:hypothetical protein